MDDNCNLGRTSLLQRELHPLDAQALNVRFDCFHDISFLPPVQAAVCSKDLKTTYFLMSFAVLQQWMNINV